MSLNLPDGGFLQFTEPAHPLSLYGAYGGAQLKLDVGISSNKASNNAVFLAGVLYAGRGNQYHDLLELCRLSCEYLVTPIQATNNHTFTGFVTDKALAEVEEARHGGALRLELRVVQAHLVHGEPPRLTAAHGGDTVRLTIPAGTWAEQLEKVTATSFLDVLSRWKWRC